MGMPALSAPAIVATCVCNADTSGDGRATGITGAVIGIGVAGADVGGAATFPP